MKRESRIKPNLRDGRAFAYLVGLQEYLLSEKGCPWDREQDLKSLRHYVMQEAEEVVSAIDNLLILEKKLKRALSLESAQQIVREHHKASGGKFSITRRSKLKEPSNNYSALERNLNKTTRELLNRWQEARDALKEEIGDLLMQPIFESKVAEKLGYFSLCDVINSLYEKLIRRHPHVFHEIKAKTSKEVLKKWREIKKEEKKNRRDYLSPLG